MFSKNTASLETLITQYEEGWGAAKATPHLIYHVMIPSSREAIFLDVVPMTKKIFLYMEQKKPSQNKSKERGHLYFPM